MLQKIQDYLLTWDYTAWYTINTLWHTPFLDLVVPFLRNQWFWVPLYLFLLIFMTMKFGKRGWVWCVTYLISFILSDQISATILKPIFHRLRPCNDPHLTGIVHTLVSCGAGYSFPSSHAANHFAMGMFMSLTLMKRVKWIWFIPLLWALVVSFAQVYVGVHYPLDVTCGGILGMAIGAVTATIFNRISNKRYSLAKANEPN